jgi:hypothetical protein
MKSTICPRLKNLQRIKISKKRQSESNVDFVMIRRQGIPVVAGVAAVVEAMAA